MKIIDVKNAQKMKNPFKIDAAQIYNTDHAVAVHMTLKAGEKLKPHITPVDVFFYVLEGEPSIEIGEEKVKVPADHLVDSPAKIPHCIYNESDKVARILVVKIPKPTEETKFL
ncbi:MAG TPA: cupin domain-containing protein [Candidatus Eremiobacteraeota bacterium]|nr:cupin domain-containing protein [Candidatus Eremiobacteraeota bacterium]